MNHEKHIELFHELGANRAALPYELTKVFSDCEESSLNSSLILSFEHVERVLMFKRILEYQITDPKEFVVYLEVAMEQTSYYSCMALPLIRQIIESKEAGIKRQVEFLEQSQSRIAPVDLFQTEEERAKVSSAYKLASIARSLSDRYAAITNSDCLFDWAKEFSVCCAYFIILEADPGFNL